MRICLIGEKTTNNRIGMFIDALFHAEEFEILWDGRSVSQKKGIGKLEKDISDILNIFRSDVVYFAPFSHSQKRKIKLAHLLRKYIIVDFYVSFYDMLVNDRKVYAKDAVEAKKLRDIDASALLLTNKVLFLNDSEKKFYISCSGIKEIQIKDKVCIVPLVFSKPKKLREIQEDYFEKKKLKILWMGSYVPLHGLSKIINACNILKNNNLGFELTIWGTSKEVEDKYRTYVQELELEEYIRFRNDWNGKDYYYSEIRKQDILLGIFGDSEKAKTVVANKVIDAVLNKTPVITGRSSGISEFFDGKTDIWICNNTPEAIAEEIQAVSKLSKDVIQMRVDNAYKVYEEYFSDDAFNRNIDAVINSINSMRSKK